MQSLASSAGAPSDGSRLFVLHDLVSTFVPVGLDALLSLPFSMG